MSFVIAHMRAVQVILGDVDFSIVSSQCYGIISG